jgi:hypothetical protein
VITCLNNTIHLPMMLRNIRMIPPPSHLLHHNSLKKPLRLTIRVECFLFLFPGWEEVIDRLLLGLLLRGGEFSVGVVRWENFMEGLAKFLANFLFFGGESIRLEIAHGLGLVMLAGEGQCADWTTANLRTYLLDVLAGLVLGVVLLMYNTQPRPLHNLIQFLIINSPINLSHRLRTLCPLPMPIIQACPIRLHIRHSSLNSWSLLPLRLLHLIAALHNRIDCYCDLITLFEAYFLLNGFF